MRTLTMHTPTAYAMPYGRAYGHAIVGAGSATGAGGGDELASADPYEARRGRGYGRTRIGAVAAHLWADRDSAGAAIDAQIIAMARAVVSAAGGDPSLIRSRAQAEIAQASAYTVQRPGGMSPQERAAYQALGVPNLPPVSALATPPSSGPTSPGFAVKVLESRAAIDKSPLADLWYNGISPLLDEWNGYYADKHHWYDAVTEVFTSWEDYTAWAKRVNDMRRRIEKAGIALSFPPLADFPRSFQDVAEDGLSSLWSILKWGLIAALGIGGVVLLLFAFKGRSVRSLYR